MSHCRSLIHGRPSAPPSCGRHLEGEPAWAAEPRGLSASALRRAPSMLRDELLQRLARHGGAAHPLPYATVERMSAQLERGGSEWTAGTVTSLGEADVASRRGFLMTAGTVSYAGGRSSSARARSCAGWDRLCAWSG